jgi:hypothetical protein
MKKTKNKIVVDEAVSNEMVVRFQTYLTNKGYKNLDTLFITKKHQGMPDGQILHHLLNSKTIFVTTDRPLHNKVLSQSLKSYYVNKNTFISRKLKGITNKNYILHKNDLNVKENYHLPKTDIRSLLLPSSEKSLKKLRTKRRRIRSHFDGQEHLNQVAITVSCESNKLSTLFGIKFRISSNVGIKALDASESYIRDKIVPENRTIVALSYALILSIQLMLHFVKTRVYYDSPKIDDPLLYLKNEHQTPYSMLFAELTNNFPNLEFIPSTKGLFVERLRAKLGDLSKYNSNEIVAGNIADVLVTLKNINPENNSQVSS